MPVSEFVSCAPISGRAKSYGFDGVTVDGNDVELVRDTAEKAIKQARSGSGPFLIECVTYRTKGHYGGDPEHTYRTREEVEEWKKKCPILRARNKLTELGVPADILEEIEAECINKLEKDRDWALEQRFPTVEEATDHVLI